MTTTLIQNARIFTPEQPSFIGWLLIRNDRIADFGKGSVPEDLPVNADETIDAKGQNLLPGLIDIHTHGCLGHCTMDADPEGLFEIASFHARHGVTTYLPTTMTGTREQTVKAIRCVSKFVGKTGDFAKIAGEAEFQAALDTASKLSDECATCPNRGTGKCDHANDPNHQCDHDHKH